MLIERWAGQWSFRANIGPLWFGANFRTPGFFILLEGGPQFLSWQPLERLMLRALVLASIIVTIAAIF